MKLTQAKRLLDLPPYIFSEINAIKAQATKRGISLLSLGIGDPDRPTPTAIVEKIIEASRKGTNHAYSPYEGTLEFRNSVADWLSRRFGITLSGEKEIVALIGSKEGIAHFPLAFCNPGDKCLYPNPGYPIFSTAVTLAHGIPIGFSCRAENKFLPDLNELEELLVLHRPKYMLVNFPSNPTTAVCPKSMMEEIVFLARKYETILVSDNAYSEMYFDESDKPHSFLEVDGAKDVTIEMHSFSKTFNMTGWRIAFAAGNEQLVAGLLRAKTNIDSGPLLAVQEASVFALKNAKELSDPIRAVYRERREILLQGLDELGIEYLTPKATFFVWARVPKTSSGSKSMEFTKALIDKVGLVVTPGIGFGSEGEGFFRMSLTVSPEELRDAIQRLKKFLQ